MEKTHILFQGITEFILLQIPLIVWGIDAFLDHTIIAVFYLLLFLDAAITVIAGSGVEVRSLNYGQVAGIGQIVGAVGMTGIIVVLRIWESPHSPYPVPLFAAGIAMAVVVWIAIGLDMITASGYIVDPEQYTAEE